MFIKVTRNEAITRMMKGELVWFGSAAHPEVSTGFELDTRHVRSRRRAASYPNKWRWLEPRGTRWAWFIRAEGA